MKKSALILIDIQNDFMPQGALPVPEGHLILPALNRLLSLPFDFILATKDWHPIDHASFAPNQRKQVGQTVTIKGIEQILWPVHCVQGTWGAEFCAGWDTQKVDKIFHKGTDPSIDSYSAFFDNGHLKSTGLENYLKQQGVHYLYIAGLATDYCVKYSVLDALKLGFTVYVITDACRGINLEQGDTDKAFKEMERSGAVLKTSTEVETDRDLA